MSKIKMINPISEADGDEMTRVLWAWIKDELILPYVDLKTEYYDLGLLNRDRTDDNVTKDFASSIKRLKVGVKCATITPNEERMTEYKLKKKWKSPNGTIRAILDGTVFRTPIISPSLSPVVKGWKKPITISRHAFGDVYLDTESEYFTRGKAELVFTSIDGTEERKTITEDYDSIIVEAMFNTHSSIYSFARSSFEYALSRGEDLWFSSKDTISKTYDGAFKRIFQDVYDNEYKDKFQKKGITYFYTLIDDAISRVMKSEGGFVWALKNYDGDVISDMVSSSFSSLAMMSSVLLSPLGEREYEAAHGTVTKHYRKYLNGEETSTNPTASIYAWTGALRRRGELDNNKELITFSSKVEKATLDCIENGTMTGDLIPFVDGGVTKSGKNIKKLDSLSFIKEIRSHIEND